MSGLEQRAEAPLPGEPLRFVAGVWLPVDRREPMVAPAGSLELVRAVE